MKSIPVACCTCAFLLFMSFAYAQEKDIAKVDALIAKAKETTDAAKKASFYNKAAEIIMSARLDKSQYAKIGDAYLDDGDITNAVKFYSRCDKESKNAGLIKVGHKMIEQAFDDPKSESKTINKALSYFSKAGAANEGYEAAGDAYYARGKEYYMKAAEYYAQGNVTAKLEKIASEFLNDKKPDLAAEVYMTTGTPESLKKAGDLYYSIGDFYHAFTAYEKAGYTEGLKKYADQLYNAGEKADGDAIYARIADMYAEKNNKEGLTELAKAQEQRGYYNMAASLYERAGDTQSAARARAFELLLSFDLQSAQTAFEAIGDADMGKAIKAHLKPLTSLKEVADYFDDVKANQPYVSFEEDPVTHKKTANSAEMESFNSYYRDLANTIVDYCYTVSDIVPKISHAGLKTAMMKKFSQYGAIRNILTEDFGKKLRKEEVTAKDVIL
ncbi:MAG: hypothetical protein KatS3mg031_2074 [Chitinophagales bacterium]|nr:MAG: hypothetical protein KatS3mg031_2074 [Chitinophagales bacterium]